MQEGSRFLNYQMYAKPSLSILRVCKQIRYEAESMYLERNTFMLPSTMVFHYPLMIPDMAFDNRNPTIPYADRILFSAAALGRIRNISIAFCNRTDSPLTISHSEWMQQSYIGQPTFEDMPPEQRMLYAHYRAKLYQISLWMAQVEALMRFEAQLDLLELDLTNVYCPFGCCRDFPVDFRILVQLKPKLLRFLGMRPGEVEQVEALLEEASRGRPENAVGKVDFERLEMPRKRWGT